MFSHIPPTGPRWSRACRQRDRAGTASGPPGSPPRGALGVGRKGREGAHSRPAREGAHARRSAAAGTPTRRSEGPRVGVRAREGWPQPALRWLDRGSALRLPLKGRPPPPASLRGVARAGASSPREDHRPGGSGEPRKNGEGWVVQGRSRPPRGTDGKRRDRRARILHGFAPRNPYGPASVGIHAEGVPWATVLP